MHTEYRALKGSATRTYVQAESSNVWNEEIEENKWKQKVARGGIEPTTFALLARRSNQLS